MHGAFTTFVHFGHQNPCPGPTLNDAKRIYGIFAFTFGFLKKFYKTKASPLEIIESCDSNRICDNYSNQYIARYKNIQSFSVDCIADLKKVEKVIRKDSIFKIYEKNC